MNADTLEEQNTIGAVMLTPTVDLPPVVHELQPEHFSDGGHGQIWMAIQELLGKGIDPDESSVCIKLREWDSQHQADVCEMAADVPCVVNLAHWAQLVLDAGRAREIRRRVTMAADRAKGSQSLEDMTAAINEASKALYHETASGGLRHVGKVVPEIVQDMAARHQDPECFRICRTGIEALDQKVEMQAAQLTIIAGRPGMGKTALAGNIATNAAKRSPVALFSLEMSAMSLVMRMASSVAGRELKPDHRAEAALSQLKASNLYIDDRGGLAPGQIRAALTRIANPKLVIVDYLQLVTPTSDMERHDLRIGSITKALKQLSKDFKCHVILLSQLNRKVESRTPPRPTMSDLRDSGAIEEDADNIWLIYRPGYYDKDAGDDTEIIVDKNRHGETGVVRAKWHGPSQRFLAADYPDAGRR